MTGEAENPHADFVAALSELVESIADRLDPQALRSIRGLVHHGEEGLGLDGLAAAVTVRRLPLTAPERDALRTLLDYFDLADIDPKSYPFIHDREAVLASLSVVDR